MQKIFSLRKRTFSFFHHQFNETQQAFFVRFVFTFSMNLKEARQRERAHHVHAV